MYKLLIALSYMVVEFYTQTREKTRTKEKIEIFELFIEATCLWQFILLVSRHQKMFRHVF